jgi:hypothetical protein
VERLGGQGRHHPDGGGDGVDRVDVAAGLCGHRLGDEADPPVELHGGAVALVDGERGGDGDGRDHADDRDRDDHRLRGGHHPQSIPHLYFVSGPLVTMAPAVALR